MADLFGNTAPASGGEPESKPARSTAPRRNARGRAAGGPPGSTAASSNNPGGAALPAGNPVPKGGAQSYTAKDIEVLEGLEPVRRRPGMYVGGTDERALHHLAAEILDNAMDEVIAGHASWIDVVFAADGGVTVRDNGRGMPVDEHPKYPGQSVLDVILTTLHSGGKFGGDAYATSGGLHGVGISVVNALSERMTVEVAREKRLWRRHYSRGVPVGDMEAVGAAPNRRGTTVTFSPDPEIFGQRAAFRAERLYKMARAKAYLSSGVEIRWQCDPAHLQGETGESVPETAVLHFPGGLADRLQEYLGDRPVVGDRLFRGAAPLSQDGARIEWAVAWPIDGEGASHSYCNAIPTPDGGTHESGLRTGLVRAMKAFGEMTGQRRAQSITAEDVLGGAVVFLSAFLRDPSFQGQTKERLASPEASRLIESAIKDPLDHWLSEDTAGGGHLLSSIIERAEERLARRKAKDLARKSATRKLRLPGKLADCSSRSADGTEIFLVEGESAGGSAKAARDRNTQAVLPLRGKILNVASASADKLAGNQEVGDLKLALGCGTGRDFSLDNLRYERVIIMTDADVDGAHIAALLLTFFYSQMPGLITSGHLFLAQPPLYRLQQGGTVAYARDDAHKDALMASQFTGRGKVEISRFKGLGEMPARQLRETTMDASARTLWQVSLDKPSDETGEAAAGPTAAQLVESLMGRKPESRLKFIQDNALRAPELDI